MKTKIHKPDNKKHDPKISSDHCYVPQTIVEPFFQCDTGVHLVSYNVQVGGICQSIHMNGRT